MRRGDEKQEPLREQEMHNWIKGTGVTTGEAPGTDGLTGSRTGRRIRTSANSDRYYL